jgi:hypothetical protein
VLINEWSRHYPQLMVRMLNRLACMMLRPGPR